MAPPAVADVSNQPMNPLHIIILFYDQPNDPVTFLLSLHCRRRWRT